MTNRKSTKTAIRSNVFAVLILNCFLHNRIFVVVVDALLSVDICVTTVGFNKPPVNLPLLKLKLSDSSLPQTPTFFFTSLSMSTSSSSSTDNETSTENCATEKTNRKKRSMYSFSEARKLARGHGFGTKEEFFEYDCPGAYQLPKNADVVWSEDWTSWENFLGVPLEFSEAREVARARVGPSSVTKWKASTEAEYKNLFEQKVIDDDGDIASRLPYRPDLKYKTKGWISWEDFLQPSEE